MSVSTKPPVMLHAVGEKPTLTWRQACNYPGAEISDTELDAAFGPGTPFSELDKRHYERATDDMVGSKCPKNSILAMIGTHLWFFYRDPESGLILRGTAISVPWQMFSNHFPSVSSDDGIMNFVAGLITNMMDVETGMPVLFVFRDSNDSDPRDMAVNAGWSSLADAVAASIRDSKEGKTVFAAE